MRSLPGRSIRFWGSICFLSLTLAFGCLPQKNQEEAGRTAPETSPDPVSTWLAAEAYTVDCQGERIDLAEPVRTIAAQLEAEQYAYDAANIADCSGMFHRVLRAMKGLCPNHPYPNAYTSLRSLKYRDTRSLARWYHEQGKLVLIDSLKTLDMARLIKPGAVLFYGYEGQPYRDITLPQLFQPGTGINHMGVVVAVEKDAAGRLTHYHLFHGRNPAYPAGITRYHYLSPTRATYPPLGNGRQPWVAFAPLIWD